MLQGVTGDDDVMVMFGKGGVNKTLVCTTCSRKGHTRDNYWETIGYPQWHYKYKPGQKRLVNKWIGNKKFNAPKVANNAQGNVDTQQAITMTAQ